MSFTTIFPPSRKLILLHCLNKNLGPLIEPPHMQETTKENPKQFLKSRLGKRIRISLKWNVDYEGTLDGFDDNFNIEVSSVSEFVESRMVGKLKKMVIRCNNIKSMEDVPSNEQ
ncbi:Small nuclear ribonucleoprotein (snRNP) SMF [Trachipleistophora hominis]|uniref:Small nuclear ribonucleoprotein (SnRNP) SMF n=1 Tax=Trachipleistophora hominis TaxID=72359 RepID=L7JWC3_TRAHO|nr:Small nuclear ribonucleoprotein (snRNP) SMF [Trachipleistophora hominis]